MRNQLDPKIKIDIDVFIEIVTQGWLEVDGVGEVESMRIEKQFEKYNVKNFEFDTGLIGVDELYKKDFDEIIEQCLDRIEPN